MMKRTLAAALALLPMAAGAADLPRRDKMENPFPPAIESLPVWSGAYAGALVGFGLGASTQADDAGLGNGAYHPEGGLGGLTLGYNTTFGSTVVGIEGDAALASIKGSSAWCGSTPGVCGTKADQVDTLRLRIGMPFANTLLYMTGGLAVAHVKASNDLNMVSGTRNQMGWTIGAGIEHQFTRSWSVKGEYLYGDFGKKAYYDVTAATPEKTSLTMHMFRAGVNYRFD